MADINEIITEGIGTPSTIPHFILLGLNPNPGGAPSEIGSPIQLLMMGIG